MLTTVIHSINRRRIQPIGWEILFALTQNELGPREYIWLGRRRLRRKLRVLAEWLGLFLDGSCGALEDEAVTKLVPSAKADLVYFKFSLLALLTLWEVAGGSRFRRGGATFNSSL